MSIGSPPLAAEVAAGETARCVLRSLLSPPCTGVRDRSARCKRGVAVDAQLELGKDPAEEYAHLFAEVNRSRLLIWSRCLSSSRRRRPVCAGLFRWAGRARRPSSTR